MLLSLTLDVFMCVYCGVFFITNRTASRATCRKPRSSKRCVYCILNPHSDKDAVSFVHTIHDNVQMQVTKLDLVVNIDLPQWILTEKISGRRCVRCVLCDSSLGRVRAELTVNEMLLLCDS